MNIHSLLSQTERQRVSDGAVLPILSGCESSMRQLVLFLPQLGDFDSLEYPSFVTLRIKEVRNKPD
jgi:hypothetical protein